MISSPPRPLLFLDVDGPLIPFGATREQRPDGYPTYTTPETGGNPLLARVNPALGPRLMALPCDLVWATTWESDANEYLAPLLGLPQLPFITWPMPADEPEWGGPHWKTRTLVDWSGGARSPGRTTRSPTRTARGWPPTTPALPFSTGSTPGWG